MSAAGRLIIANLACESEWGPERARRGLSAGAARAAGAYATLLRAFAAPGDRLWLPADPGALALPAHPHLGVPILCHGRRRGLAASIVLAWGETEALRPLRQAERRETAGEASVDGPIHRAVWSLPPAPAAIAALGNDRRFALEAARDLGCALPGVEVARSMDDARRWIENGGASASALDAWVMKAPFASSGRERVRGSGRRLDGAQGRSVAALVERFGAVLCEPWMDRTADFGICILVSESRCRLLPPHRLHVGDRGDFRGVDLGLGTANTNRIPGLDAGEITEMERVATAMATRLHKLGYRGPCSVDCWRWRDSTGRVRFHPLGEVNARMTFGLVARALVERLTAAGEAAPAGVMSLRLGTGADLAARLQDSRGVVPLVAPAAAAREAAWAELGTMG